MRLGLEDGDGPFGGEEPDLFAGRPDDLELVGGDDPGGKAPRREGPGELVVMAYETGLAVPDAITEVTSPGLR